MPPPALRTHLESELDTTVEKIAVLHEGLNTMWTVTTTAGTYIVRSPNKLRDTTPFNSLNAEYDLLTHLAATPIPAPEPVYYCDDTTAIGTEFLVTTYREGTVLDMGDPFPDRFQTRDARAAFASQYIDLLADIHTLDPTPMTDCLPEKSPRDQVRIAADRIDAATSVTDHTIPNLDVILTWLQSNAPNDDEPPVTLVHGDYRPGNILITGDTTPTITGILDWEVAFRGNPHTELGYVTLLWGHPPPDDDALTAIEATYPDADALPTIRAYHTQGFQPYSTQPGSPTTETLITHYETTTNTDVGDLRYYRVHAALMLITVWADLHRLVVQTDESSIWRPYIDYLAHRATHLITTADQPIE